MRLYARAQLRIVEQAERLLSGFGAPDGVVVRARRDVWRSDGALQGVSCDSCWSDLQTPCLKTGETATAALWLCVPKHTHTCILDFACNAYCRSLYYL